MAQEVVACVVEGSFIYNHLNSIIHDNALDRGMVGDLSILAICRSISYRRRFLPKFHIYLWEGNVGNKKPNFLESSFESTCICIVLVDILVDYTSLNKQEQ